MNTVTKEEIIDSLKPPNNNQTDKDRQGSRLFRRFLNAIMWRPEPTQKNGAYSEKPNE